MKVLVDEQLTRRLREIHEAVEIRDMQGRTYGYFHPVVGPPETQQPSVKSPFSDEELSRRQGVPGGRPLAEIWKDLGAR
jgi:hypothetical protein